MKHLALLSVMSIGFLTVYTTSFAETPSEQTWNKHKGMFIEVNVGPNLYAGAIVTENDTFSSSGFQGAGWSAALGYNFSNHFGLEGGFMQNYAHYEINDESNVSAHTNVPYMAMRFTVPIGNKLAFIAKLGGMYAWINGSDNPDIGDSTPKILLPYSGVGFSYALTPKLEITTQYQGAIYGVVNGGLLSGGLTYHL